jgi:hypothetical protein
MSHRCAAEHAAEPSGRRVPRPDRGSTALFTTWHALRRHIDLCRTSTAMCRLPH